MEEICLVRERNGVCCIMEEYTTLDFKLMRASQTHPSNLVAVLDTPLQPFQQTPLNITLPCAERKKRTFKIIKSPFFAFIPFEKNFNQ